MIRSALEGRTGLVLVIALALLTAGCAGGSQDGDNTTDDSSDDPQESEGRCRSQSARQQGQSGAQIVCQNVRGQGVEEQAFDCPDPTRSAVRVATNTTAGAVTIRVTDAGGSIVFEETYEETGPNNDSARIGEGQAGSWTVEGERDTSFEGSFALQVACAAEGGGGRSLPVIGPAVGVVG